MRRIALAILLFFAAFPAFGAVIQGGNVTPGHIAVWATNGVVQDGGTAASGALSSLGLTSNNSCSLGINTGPITSAYSQMCLGVNSVAGAGILSLSPYGGASALPFELQVGGTTVLTATSAGVTIPSISIGSVTVTGNATVDGTSTLSGGGTLGGTWGGGLGLGASPANKSPLYVLDDNDPNEGLQGWNPGCRIMVGADQTSTPATGDTAACTIYVNNLHGRTNLWGLDILDLQDAAGADGMTRGIEIEVNNMLGFNSDPFSGSAPYRKNGLELVAHSSSAYQPTAAAMIWANDTTGTKWWYDGLAISRVSNDGVYCQVNPGGSSDTGTAFQDGCFADHSNSARVLAVTGSHSILIDASQATAVGTFLKGSASAAGQYGLSNGADYGSTWYIDSGNTASQQSILSLNDRGTQKWWVLKQTDNSFNIYNVATAKIDIAINPTTDTTTINNGLAVTGPVKLAAYTVATLPACNSGASGDMVEVTDATAPTYNGTLTGGGAVAVPAFCNGTAWTSH